MIPHTLTLEPGLIVHHVYVGYWCWSRPTPEEIRQDFQAIARKIRPDWNLSSPGLRKRWESEDHRTFWPYGGDLRA